MRRFLGMSDDTTILEGEDRGTVDAAEVAEVATALERRVAEGGDRLSAELLKKWRARYAAERGTSPREAQQGTGLALQAELEQVVEAAVAAGDVAVAEGAMRRLEALQDAALGAGWEHLAARGDNGAQRVVEAIAEDARRRADELAERLAS